MWVPRVNGNCLQKRCERASRSERSELADQFLSIPVPKEFQLSVPKFPDVEKYTGLAGLIWRNSWAFERSRAGFDWLQISPEAGAEDPA